MLSQDRTDANFVRFIALIHGVLYGLLVALFAISYGIGLYMLKHSPQDALTFVLKDLLDGYALTIFILGVVVYGLKSLGLLILAYSLKTESKSGQLVGIALVALTSISI